jgi:hypothetical protein
MKVTSGTSVAAVDGRSAADARDDGSLRVSACAHMKASSASTTTHARTPAQEVRRRDATDRP